MSQPRSIVVAVVSWLAVAAARPAWAGQEGVLQRMTALNNKAIAAFRALDHKSARSLLLQAVKLGKENGLEDHPMMARTCLHLAVVYHDGIGDSENGSRYVDMALSIRPDIELSAQMRGKNTLRDLEEARAEAEATGQPAAAPPVDRGRAQESRQREDGRARESAAAAEREARECVQREADLQKLLLASEEREKRERAAKGELQVELSELRERERRDRSEKETLQAELQRREEQWKQQTAQREEQWRRQKEQVDKRARDVEKQLAESLDREGKALVEKDKLSQEKRVAEMREAERKAQVDQERQSRDKLREGPDLPAEIPRALFCPPLADAQAGRDVYIHCAVQPGHKTKEVVLYFRAQGTIQYNAVSMELNKKGWVVALIPGGKVKGKIIQYYAEAYDAKDQVVGFEGEHGSPNILMVRAAAAAGGKSTSSVAASSR